MHPSYTPTGVIDARLSGPSSRTVHRIVGLELNSRRSRGPQYYGCKGKDLHGLLLDPGHFNGEPSRFTFEFLAFAISLQRAVILSI